MVSERQGESETMRMIASVRDFAAFVLAAAESAG